MRLVDADVLNKSIKEPSICDINETDFLSLVAEQSTVDAEIVRHGEWIQARSKDGYAMGCNCSLCGRRIRNQSKWHPDEYCPKCGAKMDLK